MNRKLMLAAISIAMFATSANAGVCKIGNTEYDSLQEAFNSKTSASADFTVTLLQDIDVASSAITVPSFNRKTCTVDGAGHAIRQAYAGRMFSASAAYTYIVFKNVTILGGGEEYSSVSAEIHGTVLKASTSGPLDVTLESGCIVSNFVSYGTLFGTASNDNYPNMRLYVKPGSVVACNSSTQRGCVFCFGNLADGQGIFISGGEIYGNSAPTAVIAYLTALNQNRTKPICTISGGRIHDNTGTASGSTLFYCDYGPIDIQMTGGEIFDNTGSVFYILRGGAYLSRVHFSGGKVFGNSGYGVYCYQDSSNGAMLLNGDAIVAGNKEAGSEGLFHHNEYKAVARTALDGDFTGFAYLSGDQSGSQRYIGNVYGTNLASYVGAERIYQAGSSIRVLQTDVTTGELKWQEPKSAKIGATEYATLAAALSAATDGATIELMRDCLMTASIVPPANKAITINGASYRIFRRMKDPLVTATTDGGNMTFTNVELNEGYFTCRDSYTNHVDGVLVKTHDGVAATVTLGPGTILSGGRGTNALVRVANGATVNLDGCVITGAVNRAVAASAGGTLGVRGATIVKNNAGGDIDVANGNILSLNGDLTGSVHVTVAGAEACEGQRFGTRTGEWTGYENFINGGADPKLQVSKSGALVWYRRGFVIAVW